MKRIFGFLLALLAVVIFAVPTAHADEQTITPNVEYNIIHRGSGGYLDAKDQRAYVNSHRDGNRYQIWTFIPVKEGGYQIKQASTGQVLDAGGAGNEVYTNRSGISNPFQVWKVQESRDSDGNLIYQIYQNPSASGKFLDSDGDRVYLSGYNVGNKYQEWKVRKPR